MKKKTKPEPETFAEFRRKWHDREIERYKLLRIELNKADQKLRDTRISQQKIIDELHQTNAANQIEISNLKKSAQRWYDESFLHRKDSIVRFNINIILSIIIGMLLGFILFWN